MPEGIIIVGSTGSIGRQALEVARTCREEIRPIGLAAGRNLDLLAQQVREWAPAFVAAPSLRPGDSFQGARVLAIEDLCQLPAAERVLISTVGSIGLAPTLAALRAGKTVALANKEVLVMAGEAVIAESRRNRATILPVDSEHNALWQCLFGDCQLQTGQTQGPIERVILTASGGAFRDSPPSHLSRVTPEQALAHPNWVMGPKVTIDSATLMNKGFEVIEAHWLFGLPYEQIEVLLHRESVVHALVEFIDGSVRATLGPPDMRLPIQHALTYPARRPSPWTRLRLGEVGKLSFASLEAGLYPCFDLAIQAARAGGNTPAVLSTADDLAVQAFLDGAIRFTDIADVVDTALQAHLPRTHPSIDEVIDAERWTRSYLGERLAHPAWLS